MHELDRPELERQLRDHPLVAPRLKHERDAQSAEAAVRECIYGETVPISSWLRSSTYQQVKLAFSQITSELPIAVGDREVQTRFIANNRDFLIEHRPLHNLLGKVVLRDLPLPPQDEVDRHLALPENDPSVIAFENKITADNIVFGFGRVIADDFGEILTLAGNGRGIGANKILRGMYESLVTAAYIAKNPSEARPFAEDDAIKKWKLWERMVEFSPETKNSLPAQKIADLEAAYKSAKANRPKGQKEWTSVNLSDRAKLVDKNLYGFYGPCYLEPTFHTHATASGLGLRFRRTDEGVNSYREITEKEARKALQLSHVLVLNLLSLQNDYFKLGLDDEIHQRLQAFMKVWKKSELPENSRPEPFQKPF
jgi:hypothetical protein